MNKINKSKNKTTVKSLGEKTGAGTAHSDNTPKRERTEKPSRPDEGNCPVYKKCSGCALRNMSYDEHLKFKFVKVDRLMGRLCRPDKVIGMDDTRGCRGKVQTAYDFINGKAVSGIYRSATGGVTKVKDCPVNNPAANRIGNAVLETAVSLKIPVYCSYNGSGFLRHTLIRAAGRSGEIMCVVVGAAREFPEKSEFVKRLMKKCPEITSLYFSVSSSKKMVTGGCTERLWGKEYIEDIICGSRFIISPKSFWQVNPRQAEILYELAIKYADIRKTDTVIDAYCGTGTLTVLAAKRAKYVYGCEINESAAADGQKNLKLNGIENGRIVNEDSGRFAEEFYKGGLKADIIILDPARAGCDRRFLGAAARISPKRIVYISCDPETQSRDMFFLVQQGYRVKKITPVDMFPWTGHVECVVLMSRAKG